MFPWWQFCQVQSHKTWYWMSAYKQTYPPQTSQANMCEVHQHCYRLPTLWDLYCLYTETESPLHESHSPSSHFSCPSLVDYRRLLLRKSFVFSGWSCAKNKKILPWPWPILSYYSFPLPCTNSLENIIQMHPLSPLMPLLSDHSLNTQAHYSPIKFSSLKKEEGEASSLDWSLPRRENFQSFCWSNYILIYKRFKQEA